MDILYSLVFAFSMYSKIPMPRLDFAERNIKYTMGFFPLVGVVTGGIIMLWFQLGEMLPVGPLLKAAVMMLIPIAVSGGIHMDGFMDTVDALSSYGSVEKRLEILKDPNAGAFAVLACGGYLLLGLGMWSEATYQSTVILAMGFVISRALSGAAVILFSKGKKDGIAAAFAAGSRKKTVLLMLLVQMGGCAVLMVRFQPVLGGAALAGALLSFTYYRFWLLRRFGGVTGDLAGYFLQVCEMAMCVCVILSEIIWIKG